MNRQVRDEFKSRILGTTQISSAFTNRGADLTDADLPAAIVGSDVDEVEVASKGTSTSRELYERTLEVTVVVVANGDSETLDDDLDALRVAVEVAIETDDDLGGLAQDVLHAGAELDMGTDEEGHRWYAFLTLRWNVVVWTRKGDPEAAL